MDPRRKTWDDYVLFYGGEALVMLVAEAYVIYHSFTNYKSLPFCIGMALTALVAVLGMHWALTKYCPKLIGGGYAVWLGLTAIMVITAGVLWTADDRRADHEKAVAERSQAEAARAAQKLEADTKARQDELTSDLTILNNLTPLLSQVQTGAGRKQVLDLGRELAARPSPTPDVAALAKAAISVPSARSAETAPAEWQPFEPGTFLGAWYKYATRFCALAGLFGLAFLFGLFLLFNAEEAAAYQAYLQARTRDIPGTQPRVMPGMAPPASAHASSQVSAPPNAQSPRP